MKMMEVIAVKLVESNCDDWVNVVFIVEEVGCWRSEGKLTNDWEPTFIE